MNLENLNRITESFRENFEEWSEIGASVSIWDHQTEVLNLADGFTDRGRTRPWTPETRVLVWSATKAPAAACVLHCLQERDLDLETRVAEVWPTFGQSGKGNITFGELLSHRAGLSALDEVADVLNHDSVVAALERQAPWREPGTAHGYHPRTFGFLLDEIVRRCTDGQSLGNYWRATFGEPLGLDFWIGMPEDLVEAAAPVFPARPPIGAPPTDFLRAFNDASSLTARSFSSPRGLHSVASMNTAEARLASLPGFGGIGTVHALGRFYAMLASGGELGGKRYFTAKTLGWMETSLTSGPDSVLRMETSFSAGFMKDPVDSDGKKIRALFGPSVRAFGQPGAGGSLAFADPENGIAFAYAMNQMEHGVLPSEKALRLAASLYGEP